jgi:hypothetical protein
MHKSATKCNETIGKWCKNKHGASKIIDTLETYQWCKWIQDLVSRGSVGVKVNDDIGHYFQTHKGRRQGDLLSPILSNQVADMLAILIARAKKDGQVDGLIPHLVDGGFLSYNIRMIRFYSWRTILIKH